MRNKKHNKKIFFILLLILFISIGFAYLTTNLDISGLAILKKSVWDVHFEHIQTEYDKASINIPANITNNKLTVNFDVTLSSPGEIYSFYVDVVNNSTFDVMIENVEFTNLDDSLSNIIIPSVTYDDGISLKNNDLLKENAKEVLRVEVKYKDSITLDELPKEDKDFNLSLTITYSQANSKAKERTTIEVLSRKTPGELSVGDEIKIGDEHFYVTSSNKDTILLLAKYNLNVGYNTQDGPIGIQNELSIGNGGKKVDGHCPSVVPFSKKRYWLENDYLKSNYGTNWYDNNVYDENYSSSSGDEYSIAYYVKDYVNYLNSLGLNNIKGRLITYNELLELGCIYTESSHNCTAAPDFLKITSFWTGTAAPENKIYYIDCKGWFYVMSYNEDIDLGIRPIIEIPTTQLANDVVITFDANGGENVTSAKVSKKMFDTLEDDYYELNSGPVNKGYSLHNQSLLEIVEDESSPTGSYFHVTFNDDNTSKTSGIYWGSKRLGLGEPYYFEAILRGNGRWEVGHEQLSYHINLTDKFTKYSKYVSATEDNYNSMVFYRTLVDSSQYIDIAYYKLIHLLPEVSREGYRFGGWYTDPVEGERVTKDTIVKENTTYYAHWIGHSFDVNVIVDDVAVDTKDYTGEHRQALRFDVSINEEKVATNVTDFRKTLNYHDTYEISNLTYDETKYKLIGTDVKYPSWCKFSNPLSGTIDWKLHNSKSTEDLIAVNIYLETIN